MRTPFLLAAALVAAACLDALSQEIPTPAPAAGGPRLKFEAKDWNFGKALVGATVEHVFKFSNAGDQDLVVRRVKPSCGCTAALLSRDIVKPGESGEVKVTFSSGDRQGFQDLQVQIFSNDPREVDMGDYVSILHLRGEVTNLLSVLPGSAYFPAFLRGTPQERKITVLPVDVPAVEVVAIESTSPFVRAESKPFERGGRRGFEVMVSIAPEVPFGRLDARVLVKTNHAKQPEVRIPVFAAIHGKITVFPERLQLFEQNIAEHEPSFFVQRTTSDVTTPIPIESIETPPFLTSEVSELVPGKRVEVKLKLRPDAPRGPFAGVVRVFVRDAEQAVFEVQVLGDVPRRVKADPPALWIDGPAARVVRVTGGALRAAKVKGAPLEATVGEGGAVTVRPAGGAKPGPFAGRIVVETDVPGEERVEIPVRGDLPR